ncbi:MAG: non-canonical purine NTP pyrophosphatase, partial [Chloroflexota bacterium]
DPVFLLPSGITTAELPEAEKDRISHRGRAVQAATPRMVELLGRT